MAVSLNWGRCTTRPILMIPGPTELPYPVIQALNQPPAIQYDRTFDEEVLEPTTLALRDVFQTGHEVILLPGSGPRRSGPTRSRACGRRRTSSPTPW